MHNSGLNTVLLIAVMALIGFGIWWLAEQEPEDMSGAQLEVNLPGQTE